MFLKMLLWAWGLVVPMACLAAPAPWCKDYARHIPNVSVALCESAQLREMAAHSVLGRPLLGRDIAVPNAPLRVLVLGGIHGDEMSSSAMVFQWIQLASTPPADMPKPVQWRFLPLLNPDGLLAKTPKRVNANGVDLNRNFPTPNWERDARIYWEKRTHKDPRRWPGSKPLSEPESQFLYEQMGSFKPNLIVSIHAPYGVLDFDGPFAPPSKLGRLYLDQVGIYPGSLGNYSGVHKGVPVVTIELPSAAYTPTQAEIHQMWTDLLRWIAERMGTRPETTKSSSTPG